MKGEIKDKPNILIYFKSSLKVVLIATIFESFTWLAHFVPSCIKWHQLIQPHPLNHFVHRQK